MPPASMWRKSSKACSSEKPRPGSVWRRLQNTSSAICSCLFPAISWNRVSMVMSRFWSSSRKAVAALACAAEAILVQATFAAPTRTLPFFSVLSTLTMTLATACFASCNGPLDGLAMVAWCLLRQAFTAATSAVSAAARVSPLCRAEMGFANVSRAEPSAEVSDFNASSSFCALASMASAFSPMELRIAEAVLRSRTSCCAFFSASSFLEYSFLASTTFFLSSSTFFWALLTLGLSLDSSPLASIKGPWLQLASSAPFCLMKEDALAVFLAVSSKVLSRAFTKDA
mmetsp:Transcript_30869/g.70169  ORF Transcript_30869/g.70169 Transcript_30869/m.70169 type:complete len:285 (+) Transcript_30869:1260-2114(+)